MPLEHDSLPEMLRYLEAKNGTNTTTHFRFRNTYFMGSMLEEREAEVDDLTRDVPSHMHMLRHLVRSVRHTPMGSVPKSILKTDSYIRTTIGHYPAHCFGKKMKYMRCPASFVNAEVAHMAHYREGCQTGVAKECESYTNETVVDAAVVRFKDRLVRNVERTLGSIDLLP